MCRSLLPLSARCDCDLDRSERDGCDDHAVRWTVVALADFGCDDEQRSGHVQPGSRRLGLHADPASKNGQTTTLTNQTVNNAADHQHRYRAAHGHDHDDCDVGEPGGRERNGSDHRWSGWWDLPKLEPDDGRERCPLNHRAGDDEHLSLHRFRVEERGRRLGIGLDGRNRCDSTGVGSAHAHEDADVDDPGRRNRPSRRTSRSRSRSPAARTAPPGPRPPTAAPSRRTRRPGRSRTTLPAGAGNYTVKAYVTGCAGTTNRSNNTGTSVSAAAATTTATINMTSSICTPPLP